MNTLRQLYFSRSLTDEQVYDTILQLCRMIPDNEFRSIPFTPDTLLLDEHGNVKIAPSDAAVQDLSFCPPEHIGGKPMTAEQYWFSIALLLFWMKTGRNAYQLLPDAAFSYLCDGRRKSLFADASPADAAMLPLAALNCFTSATPSERAAGFPLLLRHALSHHPGIAQINFVLNEQVLHREQFTFSENTLEMPLPGSLNLNGTSYLYTPLTISYRPGKHSYSIALRQNRASTSGGTQQAAHYLLCTLKGNNDAEIMGELSAGGFERVYHISLTKATLYPLFIIKKTGTHREIHKNLRFELPAVPNTPQGLLIITVPPNSAKITITVMNTNRTAQLIRPIVIESLL